MLPFDNKPWAKGLAATIITVTLIAAVCVPIVLHERKALDLPIIVGIFLLLLAIVPPNILVLVQKPGDAERRRAGFMQTVRGHR